MPKFIELSPMEVKLGFVASCVEFAAHEMGLSYDVVYQRMKKVGLIENYIFPYYDVLHNPETGLYLFGDQYIADEFLLEIDKK